MAGTDKAVEQAIQKAMREGKFNNLPGEGEPLKLNENPYVDKEWRLAYDMLSRDGYALPWMDKRNAIEEELGEALHALTRTWNWRGKALDEGQESFLVENEWKIAQNRFCKIGKDLNQRIDDLNLEVPSDQFMRARVSVKKVIKSVQSNVS